MTQPDATPTDADKLNALKAAAQPVIDRLHELLGSGELQDEQIQNYLGRWMQAVED